MAQQPRKALPAVPPKAGRYEFEVVQLGPDLLPSPPVKARGPLMPAGDGDGLPNRQAPGEEGLAADNRPLVPGKEEIERLPRAARLAFARRCADRAQLALPDDPHLDAAAMAAQAARVLVERATVRAALTAQPRCLRRDRAALRRLARVHTWADDTPVPPDALGPLWPPGLEPPSGVEQPRPPAVE